MFGTNIKFSTNNFVYTEIRQTIKVPLAVRDKKQC